MAKVTAAWLESVVPDGIKIFSEVPDPFLGIKVVYCNRLLALTLESSRNRSTIAKPEAM